MEQNNDGQHRQRPGHAPGEQTGQRSRPVDPRSHLRPGEVHRVPASDRSADISTTTTDYEDK